MRQFYRYRLPVVLRLGKLNLNFGNAFNSYRSGDSKSVAPIWEELGQKYNNNVDFDLVIAKVDCTQEVQLCAEQNITDFPT